MGMKIEPDERRMDERLTEVADYLLDKSNGGEHRMVQSVRDAIQENKELRITKDALHDTLIQREQTHSDCRKRLASKKSKAESLKRAIDFQTATIARLEAELDKLRLQMVTEVTDAEARSARLEAELERVNKYNEELFEYCEKIGGMGPGIQPPLDVVDEHRPAALSARQNTDAVNAAGGE
jgi:predicted RNase H-like nuclease (RuvC/YqgF family)